MATQVDVCDCIAMATCGCSFIEFNGLNKGNRALMFAQSELASSGPEHVKHLVSACGHFSACHKDRIVCVTMVIGGMYGNWNSFDVCCVCIAK